MLELTGIGSVLRGVSVIYWLLALAAVALAVYLPDGWRRKSIYAAIWLAMFAILPAKEWIDKRDRETYAKAAWAYFKKKCETEAGEKIHKTYSGVKSVLVVKPLPPATEKDLYDQFWYGDPYSAPAHSQRGFLEAGTLTLYSRRSNVLQKGLEFVEIKNESGNGYRRVIRPSSADVKWRVESIEKPESRFGVSWEDISSPEDRKYWVAGSRFRVLDLADSSVVAERIGYFIEAGFGSTGGQRRPWLASRGPNTTCPPLVGGDYSDNWFVTKVLNPK